MRLGQRDAALKNVRAALRLDQGSQQGHLILGTLLAVDPATRREGIRQLEQVADTMPSARKILSQLEGK